MNNICIVTTIELTLEQFVIPSAIELSNLGYNVTLISSMSDDFVAKYQNQFKLINLQMGRGIHPLELIKNTLFLYKVFKGEHFSIVQYSTPNASLYVSLASYFCRVPIRLYCQWGIRYVGFRGAKRFFFKLIEKLVCRISTDIRPVSQLNMEFAVNEELYPASKAKILGSGGAVGVDLKKFNLNARSALKSDVLKEFPILKSKFVFGFVGRLSKDKGMNELLQSFFVVKRKYPNVALLIVGGIDFSDADDNELINKARNSKDVIFTGFSNCVEKYMSVMNTLVHPTYREGFGLVILQALAMKTPVITTNIPGASETIEPGVSGLLSEPKSYKSLVINMLKVKESPELCDLLATNGVLRVDKYFKMEQMNSYILEDRINLINNWSNK
jgi:glycosyltransferase involved in cell wall biosynthesis